MRTCEKVSWNPQLLERAAELVVLVRRLSDGLVRKERQAQEGEQERCQQVEERVLGDLGVERSWGCSQLFD